MDSEPLFPPKNGGNNSEAPQAELDPGFRVSAVNRV